MESRRPISVKRLVTGGFHPFGRLETSDAGPQCAHIGSCPQFSTGGKRVWRSPSG